ncbi:MAG: hypothetical protein Q4B40_03355 [Clostridia bacterium]|nr:hypothetical protein [Clostridia bacterium]
MLAPSPVIKHTAKKALKPRFLQSVAACSVLIFGFFVAELIGTLVSIFADVLGYLLVSAVLIIFAIAPLFLGVLNYFMRLIWEQNDSVLIIFKYFSSKKLYMRAIKFTLMLCLKLVTVSVIFFLPYFIIWLLSNQKLYELLGLSLPVWTSNLWALNSFVVFISLLLVCFYMIRYYLSVFIFVANDEIDVAEALNMSQIISRRTGGDFTGLLLSFAPWILLSLFVAPLIFTLPYFMASYCVHCRFAITAYNLDVDQFNSEFTPSFSTDEI